MVFAGGGVSTTNSAPDYFAFGSFTESTDPSTIAIPVPLDGTLESLTVQVATAPGDGSAWSAHADVNGSNTALTCTFVGSSTGCTDTSHTVNVSAGDTLVLEMDPTNSPARTNDPASAVVTWSVVEVASN